MSRKLQFRRRLRMESLEMRTVLSTTATVAADGVLHVEGDKGDNDISITLDGDNVVVVGDGEDLGSFALAELTGIAVEGGCMTGFARFWRGGFGSR